MIDKYLNFVNEDIGGLYRLYIDDDPSMIPGNENWDMVMDFKELWNMYEKKEIGLDRFVGSYKQKINEYKPTIVSKKGVEVWNELVIILNEFKDYNPQNSHTKFDEVYDWADKNNIEIKI